MLGPQATSAVERALGERITGARSVSGGCISPGYRVELERSGSIFVKLASAAAGDDVLRVEAESLRVLAAAQAVRVPAVLGQGGGWLALEWLEPGAAGTGAWGELGRSLAALHHHGSERGYGWAHDNFIGSLPQQNDWLGEWPAFWWERRLLPQLAQARRRGLLDARSAERFEVLHDQLDDALAAGDAEGASLLHGDLWGGNVHFMRDGRSAIIDPSSFYGHREVDLAMSRLFGGFAREFYAAYEEAWPLAEGAARREAIYQLYYLLVHVNLFGGSYTAQTLSTLERALR